MDYFVSVVISGLTVMLGEFWFLFVFLLILNIIDYITGIIKARYLRLESSKRAFKGMIKKIFIWFLITIAFGTGFSLYKLGLIFNIDLSAMKVLGIVMLVHSILNEIRSILENIVQCGKGYLVPNWLIKGLEVAQNMTNAKGDKLIGKFKKGDGKNENRQNFSK